MGFEERTLALNISDLQLLKQVTEEVKRSVKYLQIAASIAEIGLVEPPVVARSRVEVGKYLLLDGHLRIEALKDRGVRDVACLVSIDDEAFTYNKRINRIAIIQEHRMILKAIENGVSEEPAFASGAVCLRAYALKRPKSSKRNISRCKHSRNCASSGQSGKSKLPN
jgi:ParB-like chromosome segregation protein Spo0J